MSAALSFLGLGTEIGYADWGQLIALSRKWILGAPGHAFVYWYTVVVPRGRDYGGRPPTRVGRRWSVSRGCPERGPWAPPGRRSTGARDPHGLSAPPSLGALLKRGLDPRGRERDGA